MEFDESQDDVIRMASGELNTGGVGAESMSTPLLLPGDIRGGQTSTASLDDNELGSLVGAGADGYGGLTSDEQLLQQDGEDNQSEEKPGPVSLALMLSTRQYT